MLLRRFVCSAFNNLILPLSDVRDRELISLYPQTSIGFASSSLHLETILGYLWLLVEGDNLEIIFRILRDAVQ